MPARRKYPWEVWFSKTRTTIVRGIDYFISQSMMWQTVRNNASRMGVKVKVKDIGDSIVIEVLNGTEYEISDQDVPTVPDEHSVALDEDGSAEEETAQEGQGGHERDDSSSAPYGRHHNPSRPTPIRR